MEMYKEAETLVKLELELSEWFNEKVEVYLGSVPIHYYLQL